MSESAEQRKLAAIMFTDMVSYSSLSQRDSKLALELLEEHRQLLREICPRFNGTEIKTIGDAFLIEFNSALEAAQCAIAIQRALAHRNHDVTPDRRIELKIGIHIGDVVHRGGDVYGDGVNIASRIEPLAGAGGICVSMDVERQIRNALEARFEKLAPTELKNISVAMDLFRIVLPWEQKAQGVFTPAEALPSKSSTRTLAGGAIAILALLVIGIGWWWATQARRTPASPETAGRITSLAVLPFKNYSAEANQEYFADGMTDLLTTELSGIGALTVKSHQSALKFENSTKSMPEIGQELHADAIVEGSVLRDGSHVTVNVQLIEALTDRHLWAKKFEGDVTNIFKMRNEVVEAIAHEIQVAISPEQSSRLGNARIVNPAALQEYAIECQWAESEREFQRAIQLKPNYAVAHWQYGWLLVFVGRLDEAHNEMQRAVELDPLSPVMTTDLNVPYQMRAWKSSGVEAKREYDKAIAQCRKARSEEHT